jgi:hypothetical protein
MRLYRIAKFAAVLMLLIAEMACSSSAKPIPTPAPAATSTAPSPTAAITGPSPTATLSTPSQSLPLHLWISNQSLGTDTSDVQMTISLDGTVLFDKVMAFGTGHNVAMVDQNIVSGTHTINIKVGNPHSLSSDKVIDMTGELWVSVEFWFNPGSPDANQRVPFISVEVSDTSPVIF